MKRKKGVQMHNFFVCAYNSQDFAQTQENCARLHDCETVTFRNSEISLMRSEVLSCKTLSNNKEKYIIYLNKLFRYIRNKNEYSTGPILTLMLFIFFYSYCIP